MKKRQRGSAVCQQFKGIGAFLQQAKAIYQCTASICKYLENDFETVLKLGSDKFAKFKEGRIEVMKNLGKGQVSERNIMKDVGIMLNSDYCAGEESLHRLPKCSG